MTRENGLSLVEVTIILMVLSVLTAVLAPAAGNYVETTRNTKAKKDVETLGSGINELLRDSGLRCVSKSPTSSPCTITNRVELLMSGTDVTLAANKPVVTTSAFPQPAASTISAANVNWAGGTNEVADASKATMDSHLSNNAAGYTSPVFTGGGGSKAGIGWRGAYVNGPIDVDPWGYSYQANTLFLTTASDATDGTTAGLKRGGWINDVMVLSAGSNGTIQTAFGSTAATAAGDDVIYVIQGSTQ